MKPMGDGNLSLASIEVIDVDNDPLHTPISCRGTNTNNPISVELYGEQRVLQRALMSSVLLKTHQIIDLSNEEDDEVEIINPISTLLTFSPSVTETGQSSEFSVKLKKPSNPVFMCEICVEPKHPKESFNLKGCSHSYCIDCMVRYVAAKIQENVTSIKCPETNCQGVLEPEFCRSILPSEVFDRWCNALCESLILGCQRFYCPFKDCSAALLVEEGETVVESECPHCRRMFCAQCKVPWHSDVSCEEFQTLDEDERGREDIMVLQLAKNNEWQRCPKCKYIVEKSEGCLFMKCRCGFSFCYSCGTPRGNLDQFYCSNCKR